MRSAPFVNTLIIYMVAAMSILNKMAKLFRLFMKILGVISLYFIFAYTFDATMNLHPGEAILQTDKIVNREVSPDRAWVALVNHRFRLNNILFRMSITDTVWLVKAKEEERFINSLSEKYYDEDGVATRDGRVNWIEDSLLVHWIADDQLEITAPKNENGSYVLLSKQSIDGIKVVFSFLADAKNVLRRTEPAGRS